MRTDDNCRTLVTVLSCAAIYNRYNVLEKLVFTALHKMQTRSSDENSVRLCVCQTRGL